jgi:hypothetical protein
MQYGLFLPCKNIMVVPGQRDVVWPFINVSSSTDQRIFADKPFGVASAQTMSILPAWSSSGDPNADYAVFTLDRPIGTRTGWWVFMSMMAPFFSFELFFDACGGCSCIRLSAQTTNTIPPQPFSVASFPGSGPFFQPGANEVSISLLDFNELSFPSYPTMWCLIPSTSR